MREIKYKAWDKEFKKFSEMALKYSVSEINYLTDYEWIQYTNYKDLNEEELYEGDIIHYHRHEGCYWKSDVLNKLGVITWDNNALGYRIFPIDTHSFKVNYGVDGQKIITSNRVIKVGNIYESNIEELVKKFKNGELD